MTGMLASVNSLDEAKFILRTSVDIIDLKNPAQGALGALPTHQVSKIVQFVNKEKPVSATVGDLPMHPETIANAVEAMLETTVDYVKIGFFPEGNWQETLLELTPITDKGHQLIAVLFADTQPDINIIDTIKKAGFSGVMLDTMDKSKGSLLKNMSSVEIKRFVAKAKSAQLLCGLAGSLKQQDINTLMPLNVDYLGFRGALCKKHDRTSHLNEQSINTLLTFFTA